MKKVIHYKTNFLNPSETFIDRLVRNHRDWSPSALCYRKRSFTENLTVFEAPKNGFDAYINTISFHLSRTLPFYRKIISDLKPDLVHAHFGFDGYKLIRVTREFGIPLVISFYGSDVSRLPSEFGWKRRYRKLAESASHFIAASDFMRSQLIDLGFPEDRISVVRFGLDLNENKFHKNDRPPNSILMVGRLVEKKGFETALKAIVQSKKKGFSWNVDIFGDGPLKSSLMKIAEEPGLNGTVRFHGFQPVDVIQNALRNHKLILAPSVTAADGDMEGLPNTILEAMAAGTTVVSTRHAAIPEAIIHEKSGFLTDERNTDGLTEILNRIAEDRYDLAAIRANARNIIVRDYSIQQMVTGVEKIYEKAISG
jgi:colanic acid/amylovoran biosynthesis glycosyltransferase